MPAWLAVFAESTWPEFDAACTAAGAPAVVVHRERLKAILNQVDVEEEGGTRYAVYPTGTDPHSFITSFLGSLRVNSCLLNGDYLG